MSDRFVVLGIARVRSAWFRDVGRWSTTAALPVDFVRCVSTEEVRARLSSGRAYSALFVDASLPGLDRDLADAAHAAGCGVVAVDDGRVTRDWRQLGVDGVLTEPVTRETILTTLREHAVAVSSFTDHVELWSTPRVVESGRGRLVSVLGRGGSGTSTVAMASAQGLASRNDHDGLVALADLARRADLALLHDVGDVVPGVQELAEAHRTHALSSEDVRRLAFACPSRGYHLLLGLRRARDWSVLRPRAFEAAFDGLQRSYRVVVTDVDADLEGEAECGSIDVEERNLMARTAVARADVVVVVSTATVAGVHRLAHLVDEALRFDVDAARLLPIVNRAPRSPRQRSEIAGAFAHAVGALQGAPAAVASPLFLAERRRLDDVHRDSAPLPRQLVEPVTRAVEAMLDRCAPRITAAPQPVTVGRLGSWHRHD